jgi:quercetin dioxygenase-like cupin family protein
MDNFFNEDSIRKKIFDDRWVKFAFGPQGHMPTDDFNLGIVEFGEDKVSLSHTHDVSEALYVLEGKGKILLEKNEIPLKKGDFIYIPKGAEHTLVTGSQKLRILFIFSGKIVIDY